MEKPHLHTSLSLGIWNIHSQFQDNKLIGQVFGRKVDRQTDTNCHKLDQKLRVRFARPINQSALNKFF